MSYVHFQHSCRAATLGFHAAATWRTGLCLCASFADDPTALADWALSTLAALLMVDWEQCRSGVPPRSALAYTVTCLLFGAGPVAPLVFGVLANHVWDLGDRGQRRPPGPPRPFPLGGSNRSDRSAPFTSLFAASIALRMVLYGLVADPST